MWSLCQAAANIFWCNPFPLSGTRATIAGETPGWQAVHDMADFFRPFGLKQKRAADKVARDGRIQFPVVLCVHAPTLDAFTAATFPGTLDVLTGHAALYGWYLAMTEALIATDLPWIATLWQAGLTVSVQGVLAEDDQSLALLSMKQNNDLRTTSASFADTFPAFARKLSVALERVAGLAKRLEYCQTEDIRYNGQAVHRTLLLAAQSYVDKVDVDTHGLLVELDRKYGKDVLTGKYHVLTRLLQICGKEVDTAPQIWSATCSFLVTQVLTYITWALEHDQVSPAGITVEWLDKSRSGSVGACLRTLAKCQLVSHVTSMVEQLPEESKARTEMLDIMKHFTSYRAYAQAFGNASTLACGSASTPAAAPDAGVQSDPEAKDPFERIREAASKPAQTVLDFLFDIFACEHEKDIANLCGKQPGSVARLQWSHLDGDAGQKLREISRQLAIHKLAVPAVQSDGAPPPSAARTLRRLESGGSDGPDGADSRLAAAERERVETWKSAQQARKKLASISVTKYKSADELQTSRG